MRLSRVFFAAGGSVSALGAVAMLSYAYSPNTGSVYNSLQNVRSQLLAEEANLKTLDAKTQAYWNVIIEANAALNVPVPNSMEAYLQEPFLASTGFEGAVNAGLRDAYRDRKQSAGRLAELTPALRQNEAASEAQGVKGPLGPFAMLAGFSIALVGLMVRDKEAYRREKEQRQASPTF